MNHNFSKYTLLCGMMLWLGACAQDKTPLPEMPELYEDGPANIFGADGKADDISKSLPAFAALPSWADTTGGFHAMFAPDDPVVTVELALCDEVIKARKADEREYTEGNNPYRIRYAVYNLRNPRLVQKLIDANNSGVDVQILIESKQLDPAKTWNTADEMLQAAGFEFAPDHRDLDEESMQTADLVGIVDSGLMHLKSRIFQTPNSTKVLSGSMNPGDNAVMNEETLHLIQAPHLTQRYVDAYVNVLKDRPMVNNWDSERAVNVMFTPARGERANTRVFDWLKTEQEQILLMVFSLRNITAAKHGESLLDILKAKVKAGVPVYVITDRKQSDGVDAQGNPLYRNDNTEDQMRKAGIHVYEATNNASPFTAMHHKAAILGRTNIRVITDAANWTFSGLGSSTRQARNVESQLFIDSAKLDDNATGRRYLAQWLRVLKRYAAQTPSEPSFDEVYSDLASRGGWPMQAVSFDVHVDHTAFGQSVFVRGGAGALGMWGESNNGHPLTTDGELFPRWLSAEPVWLPLGQQVEWKLVKGNEQSVSWEPGENRALFVQPSVFQVDGATIAEGRWTQ